MSSWRYAGRGDMERHRQKIDLKGGSRYGIWTDQGIWAARIGVKGTGAIDQGIWRGRSNGTAFMGVNPIIPGRAFISNSSSCGYIGVSIGVSSEKNSIGCLLGTPTSSGDIIREGRWSLGSLRWLFGIHDSKWRPRLNSIGVSPGEKNNRLSAWETDP